MIELELEKYSKLFGDQPTRLTKLNLNRHTDSRQKLITYITGGLLATIIAVSLQICYTSVDPVEFNKKLFENDLETPSMQAFVNFMAEHLRTYSSRQETAYRYRVFKSNYEMVTKHNLHAKHLPFTMAVNKYADMTKEEFLESLKLRVPAYLSEKEGGFERTGLVGKRDWAPMFDKKHEGLPEQKNWAAEGKVSAPIATDQLGGSWA